MLLLLLTCLGLGIVRAIILNDAFVYHLGYLIGQTIVVVAVLRLLLAFVMRRVANPGKWAVTFLVSALALLLGNLGVLLPRV